MVKSVSYPGVLGNWELVAPLGEGAYGVVYEARNQRVASRSAAVKILHPHLAQRIEVRQRFINEATAASRADHPNVVQIFDVGETSDGLCYVVMERLRGCRLTDLLSAGPLETARVIRLLAQVASALDATHRAGVIHRDLKPDNIFVVSDEARSDFVKVLDFGIAKLRDNPVATATNVMLGTPLYMAPEQWRSERDVDGRADIYALGAILFECLRGCPPFQADSQYGYLFAHINHPPPDLRQDPRIPPGLASLVWRMLAKDRAARPATMQIVVESLQAEARLLANGWVAPATFTMNPTTSGAAVEPPPGAKGNRRARGPRARVAGLLGGVALLIVAGGWALMRAPAKSSSAAAHSDLPGSTERPSLSLAATSTSPPVVEVPPAKMPVAAHPAPPQVAHPSTPKRAPGSRGRGAGKAPLSAGPPTTKDPGPMADSPAGLLVNAGVMSLEEAHAQLLAAEVAFRAKRYADAMSQAHRLLQGPMKLKAWRLLGLSACAIRDADAATEAMQALDAGSRAPVEVSCQQRGLVLVGKRFVRVEDDYHAR